MAYLDVLTHLTRAYGILILGSTEPHYTPSKVFQAVQSKRPVLAILHEASTAVEILKRSGAGSTITLSDRALPEPSQIAAALESFATDGTYCAEAIKWGEFEAFSARESARRMAAALDEALERYRSRARRAQ